LFRDEVIARLQSNAALGEPLRKQALAFAEPYREDPARFNQAAGRLIREPGAEEAQYLRALRLAEAVCRLRPNTCQGFHTRAKAQYRLGRYQEALQSLARAAEIHAKDQKDPDAGDLAFLAMTQYQLGDKEQAQATLACLHEALKKPGPAPNPVVQAFLREAETLVGGKGPPAPPAR
jgi:tetratricopeptide (TPR) repeat protein